MNALLLAFGMPGGPEWIVIVFVVLLLFGAKKLPELARGIGRSISEFQKAKDEFATQIEKGAADPALKKPDNTVSSNGSGDTKA